MDENKLRQLYSLFGEAWFVYEEAIKLKNKNNSKLKRVGEVPILYFGNIDKYMESDIKVVTVGKNPSSAEYGGFEGVVRDIYSSSLLTLYKYKLDNYFENVPYCNKGNGKKRNEWFYNWTELLDAMKVKYGKKCKKENTNKRKYALHTDFFSPIATKPSWIKLSSEDKKELASKGIPLWFELIKFLEPDIIVMSWESKWHPFTPNSYNNWLEKDVQSNNTSSEKSFIGEVLNGIKPFSIKDEFNKKLLEEYGKCNIDKKIKLFCATISDNKKSLLVWIEGGGMSPLSSISENKKEVGKCIGEIWEKIDNICS